jgi:hypothetical protein
MKSTFLILCAFFTGYTIAQTSPDCLPLLQKTIIQKQSLIDIAEEIKNHYDAISSNDDNTTTSLGANIFIPTSSGLIPLGINYNENQDVSYYLSVLNDFQKKTNTQITSSQSIAFLPSYLAGDYLDCLRLHYNNEDIQLYADFFKEGNQNKIKVHINFPLKQGSRIFNQNTDWVIQNLTYNDELGRPVIICRNKTIGGPSYDNLQLFKYNDSLGITISIKFVGWDHDIKLYVAPAPKKIEYAILSNNVLHPGELSKPIKLKVGHKAGKIVISGIASIPRSTNPNSSGYLTLDGSRRPGHFCNDNEHFSGSFSDNLNVFINSSDANCYQPINSDNNNSTKFNFTYSFQEDNHRDSLSIQLQSKGARICGAESSCTCWETNCDVYFTSIVFQVEDDDGNITSFF